MVECGAAVDDVGNIDAEIGDLSENGDLSEDAEKLTCDMDVVRNMVALCEKGEYFGRSRKKDTLRSATHGCKIRYKCLQYRRKVDDICRVSLDYAKRRVHGMWAVRKEGEHTHALFDVSDRSCR